MKISNGAVYALLVAMLSSGVAPALKALGIEGVSPILLSGLMYLGGALFALPLAPSAIRRAQMPTLVRDWRLYVSAFVGSFLAPILFFSGLATISAATVSASLNLQQLITVVIAVLFFKEKGSWWLTMAACLMVIAGFLLTWSGGGVSSGFLLLVGSFALWGYDNNLLSKVSAYDSRFFVGLRFLLAAIAALILAYFTGASLPWKDALIVLGCGMVFNGIGFVLLLKALQTQGASKTAVFLGASPFFGFLWTALLLSEYPSFQQAVAVFFLAAGFIAGWMHSRVTATSSL